MNKGRVATIGMFDGVHLGHRSIISETVRLAHLHGMRSAVVTFDCHPLSVIAPERVPLMLSTLGERIELIRKLGVDDIATVGFDDRMRKYTAREFIEKFLIDRLDTRILVIGHDHGFGSDRVRGLYNFSQIGKETGIEIVEAPYWGNEPVSSSAVREYLADGNISDANRLLGRPFSIVGQVGKGRQIGRTIGFPTANISFSPTMAIPARGVYSAFITDITDESYRLPAMVNIGRAPTITENGPLTIEAHLFDFAGDLYNHELKVEFIARLRDEKKFENIPALKKQLEKDIASAKTSLKNYVDNYVENASKQVQNM